MADQPASTPSPGEGVSKLISTYPHHWREIINGPLEEEFVQLALSTLSELVQPDFVPTVEHVQLLLYLTITPNVHPIPPELPLDILHRLVSLHHPMSFSQGIPIHPSSSSGKNRENEPIWLQWDYKRSDLHKSIWRCMKACRNEGVWALLWDKAAQVKAKTERPGRSIDDDEEGDRKAHRNLTTEGWKLLEWLVQLWEKDRSERDLGENPIDYSPLFLKQLPRPFDRTGQLPRNDASIPISILKAAYATPSSKGEEGERRRSFAVNLLSLVIDTAIGPKAPFHPSSLSSSLVHSLRAFSTDDVLDVTKRLARSRHWRTACHILTLLIEDLGGIRTKKTEQRRAKRSSRGIDMDFEKNIDLDRPTAKYLLGEIVLLTPRDAHDVVKTTMFKVALVSITKSHNYDAIAMEEVTARYKDDVSWWNRVENTWRIEAVEEKERLVYIGLLKRCIVDML
ncbi:hypothetical protein L486_00486 [Kwoniella mangroviensis CBS 10435]|uniref:Uncharacterized protein n=1 Tax=Kwoniella mangroviensis CBS 10435 TaxID=1331196 RepID=A0A1B9IZK8_9TREE|nr:uncharacterized protein I203_06193 [Kwoniella mangroviensis CBS 8507]OCF60844.1 hypothetical protein L486_00486 [Kwoniella mangroviensis CBS 10435]OCF64464.1 hypothetical protein I203_06193 [Kwoniella mangroviensis CBS 8507]